MVNNPYHCKNPQTREYARGMKRNMTKHEKLLWSRLRKCGIPFSKQVVVCGFIVDFLNFKTKLVIEVDGESHRTPEGRERDEWRSTILRGKGFHVIRFWNEQVADEMENVLAQIEEAYIMLAGAKPDLTRLKLKQAKLKALGPKPRNPAKKRSMTRSQLNKARLDRKRWREVHNAIKEEFKDTIG